MTKVDSGLKHTQGLFVFKKGGRRMSEIKLEPYDIRKLWEHPISRQDGGYKRRNFREVLEDFVNSEHACCKIYYGDDYAKANIMAVSLRDSIKRFDYKNTVKVVARGTNVFLVKKRAWEKLSKEVEE